MRFLCLHGKGTNSRFFESQTAALRYRLGEQHQYEFLDGLLPCEPYQGLEGLLSDHHGNLENTYSWFHQKVPSLQAALSDLSDFIDSEGPFDGIMGFSQGAALAATYIAQNQSANQEQLHHEMPFKCAILLCPGPIWQWNTSSNVGIGEDEDLSHVDHNEGHLISIPTAVISGVKDEYLEGSRIMISLCGTSSQSIYQHSGGHEIPRNLKDIEGIATAVKRVIDTVLTSQ